MRFAQIAAIALLSAGSLSIAGAETALAQPRGAPKSFAGLVESVMPSVVNISTATKAAPSFGVGGAAATARQGTSLGSGFIVDPSGIVVTNFHVIRDAASITVTLESGEEYDAVLRGVDRDTDLAVLQLKADRRFPAVKFGDSEDAKVGDWVVAIGQPFGLGGSVSAGIVSARNRNIESGLYDDYIQTDAAINRGNSGGPLFDMNGRVIGVNTVIYSQSGGSVGVGFAVPGTLADRVVSQLIEFGETKRGFLGVLLEDISERQQKRLGLPTRDGALVTGLPSSSSPAALAGIQKDDVIIKYGRTPIKERRDLTRAVADTDVGSAVLVQIIRNGQRKTVRVTLARRETMTARSTGTVERAGLTLQSASAELSTLYGLSEETRGVVVTHVDGASPLAGILKPGDVILEVEWNKVEDAVAAETLLNQLRDSNANSAQVLIQRGDTLFFSHIQP
ncbi:MAG: trypsin-like peptidase domain-containing protein [Parvularcula sp.]